MPSALRIAVKTTALLLWLSGCTWLVLHFLFPVQTEFGAGPNRWEATTIRIHGIVAIFAVFLFGWIVSRHVVDSLRQPVNRASGVVLACMIAVLSISGYALYYVLNESGHGSFAIAHEVIGALVFIAALVHWKAVKR